MPLEVQTSGVAKPPKSRPAEASGLAGAVAVLLAYLIGVHDPIVIAALGVVAGAVPAAVTALVVLLRRRRSSSRGPA